MRRPLNAVLVLLALVAVACDGALGQPQPVAHASSDPASASIGGTQSGGMLPNPALTPGEVFAGATPAQICVRGYAASVRNVLREQYLEVYAAYGIAYPEPAGSYELDHLIPLELGGDNSNRNLWPEPVAPEPGFHQKDDLENYLHDAVCSGRMALADAQRGIATNWVALYREYLRP